MKTLKALLFFGLAAAGLAAPAVTESPYVYTDTTGGIIPFLWGTDTNNAYYLQFPASVTTAQQNEVLALPRFNNFPISGRNPTVTVGPIFPPGPGSPSNWITADVTENANFNVTSANYGVMFQVTTGASNITATLPAAATLPDGWYCFIRKADTGAGLVLNSQVSDSVAGSGHVTAYWTDGTAWYGRAWYGGISTTGILTITMPGGTVLPQNGIGTTSTDTLSLVNTTAAALGAQQWSPRLHFTGQGWKTASTAASQTVDFITELQTVQGGTNPTGNLVISSQVNGAGYTSVWSLSSGGLLILPVATGGLSVGGGSVLGTLNQTTSSWTTFGIQVQVPAGTFTNSSSAGTYATATFSSFGQPTLAASNPATTTTDAATVYIAGEPIAGTNMTITDRWGLWNVGQTRFDDDVYYPAPSTIHFGVTNNSGTNQIKLGATTVNNTNDTILITGQQIAGTGLRLSQPGNGVWTWFFGGNLTTSNSIGATQDVTDSFYYAIAIANSIRFGGQAMRKNGWGTSGQIFQEEATTVTDANSTGTVASAVFNSFAVPGLAAVNTGVTTTTAATVYIAGAPSAGTNETITNPLALWIGSGVIGIPGGATAILQSLAALNNGAGSGAGTLTNAPSAGNPTKWIAINDAGTTRQIPAW